MSFTVVPIHNLYLESKIRIPFGDGFVLTDIPDWLKTDGGVMGYLRHYERELMTNSPQAWVAEYDAEGIGDPDPTWNEERPHSIQDARVQSAILANTAMWLMEPTNVCFTNAFHAIAWNKPGQPNKLSIAQQTTPSNRLLCHPKDGENKISIPKVIKAGELHATLCGIPRHNAVWTALKSLWSGLTMNSVDIRYSLFWIGLEALFGAEDSREIGYKLGQRIAFFLADDPEDARNLFKMVKARYSMRSQIVHGRWSNEKSANDAMYDTERIMATAFRRLLADPKMIATFVSKKRDGFLEDWVFSRTTDPPPFPEIGEAQQSQKR